MATEFQDKVALITGGSRGLGKAMALALAARGAAIALVSRDAARLNAVKGEIEAVGGKAECFPADCTVEADVQRIEGEVKARLGRVQILINNAGINIRKNLAEFTLDEWRQVMDTSLTGAFLVSRAFLPHMKGTGYGRVINLTSIMSHVSMPERTAYASAKTALLGFTRSLALEVVREGITVNGISPGPVATDILLPIINDPKRSADFLANVPMGRWGKPEEIAALACFLCSEMAGYITGTDIVIDGGWTAR